MGCDIHFAVEIFRDGAWCSVDTWQRAIDDGDPYITIPYERRYWKERNYSLFSVLADVRNGYGFAGVDTGNGFVPIAPPRGVPSDASSEYRELVAQWKDDGHSHSYFTVRELLDYDWDQKTIRRGVVSAREFSDFQKNGKPSKWCGGVLGRDVEMGPNSSMSILLTKHDFKDLDNYYTQVQWSESYREAIGPRWFECLERLKAMSPSGTGEDIRAVFFFDN